MLWMLCCTFSLPLSLWSVAGPIWFHKLKMNLKDNLRIYTGYKSMRWKIVMGSLAVFFCKYNVAHENRKAAIVCWGPSQAAHTACCDWQHSAKYSLMYGKKWRVWFVPFHCLYFIYILRIVLHWVELGRNLWLWWWNVFLGSGGEYALQYSTPQCVRNGSKTGKTMEQKWQRLFLS